MKRPISVWGAVGTKPKTFGKIESAYGYALMLAESSPVGAHVIVRMGELDTIMALDRLPSRRILCYMFSNRGYDSEGIKRG